jgi:hypothetical protein
VQHSALTAFRSLGNKSKIANDCRLIARRRPLEAPEIDAYRGGRLRNVGRVRRIGFGLDDIGNRSDVIPISTGVMGRYAN